MGIGITQVLANVAGFMSKKFFVKIVTDPEVDLRKCVVGMACAMQAIKDGHEVSVFFASNGVLMLKSAYLQEIDDMGELPEGMIFEMMRTITDGASCVFCSTGSMAANGITPENAEGVLVDGFGSWMTWSGPPGVIELSAASEVQLVY